MEMLLPVCYWCYLICRELKVDRVILVLEGTLDFLDSQV